MNLASIELIEEIKPHSNADKLEIAKVCGYNCIVPKDKYRIGGAVVFIQPDTVLPNSEWAEGFKKFAPKRVKALKIRGEWSMGIVVSPYEVFDISDLKGLLLPQNIGKDISEKIGVTKYEAPAPTDLQAKGNLPFSMPKTDENRWQGLRHLPYGEKVRVSLKVDGSSATFYCKKDGDNFFTGICSRNMELKPECENKFTAANKKFQILEKLEKYCRANNRSLAIRGELFGQGIQSGKNNPHSKLALGWLCFSILDLDTMEYLRSEFQELCRAIEIETVPIIEDQVILTKDLIKKYDEELEELNGQPFEGVVISSTDMSFKVINKTYDSKK